MCISNFRKRKLPMDTVDHNIFEKVLKISKMEDDTLSRFYIEMKYDGICELYENIKVHRNGTKIMFGDDTSFIKAAQKHDPKLAEFLRYAGTEVLKAPEYKGKDEAIKKSLSAALGGIVLTYAHSTLNAYRLCQTRVFHETATGDLQILKRCARKTGLIPVEILSYRKLCQKLDRNNRASLTAVLFVGSDKIQINITPMRDFKLRETVKQLKTSKTKSLDVEPRSRTDTDLPNSLQPSMLRCYDNDSFEA